MSSTDIVSVSHVLEQDGPASSIPTDRLNALELDALLERRIEAARIAMTVAESTEAQRTSFEELRELISQRSQERIEATNRDGAV